MQVCALCSVYVSTCRLTVDLENCSHVLLIGYYCTQLSNGSIYIYSFFMHMQHYIHVHIFPNKKCSHTYVKFLKHRYQFNYAGNYKRHVTFAFTFMRILSFNFNYASSVF